MISTRCGRGPLANVAFGSSPTAHQCKVKLICSMAAINAWGVKALEISQRFLQSPNMRTKGRIVITPPPTIRLPWQGSLLPVTTDLRHIPPTKYGFLSSRPMRGVRGAPMRWYTTSPKKFRGEVRRRLKSDSRAYLRSMITPGWACGYLPRMRMAFCPMGQVVLRRERRNGPCSLELAKQKYFPNRDQLR